MKQLIFLLVSLSGCTGFFAQKYSTSPFSSLGLGESGTLIDPIFGSLGNASVATYDSTTINIFNPASYASLSIGQPLFGASISGRLSQLSEDGATSTSNLAALNSLAMVIPGNRYFGFAFGLKPAFRKGYDIHNSISSATGDYTYVYQGSGTGQEVFFGVGANIINNKRSLLSIGANIGYVFGQIVDRRYSVDLGAGGSGGAEEKESRLRALNYNFGTSYLVKLDSLGNKSLRVSATFSPAKKYNAIRERNLYLVPGIDTDTTQLYDVDNYILIDSTGGINGYFYQPATVNVGFAYLFKPATGIDYKRKSVYQIGIYGEYTQTMWKDYQEVFSGTTTASPYLNSNRFSVGMSFSPNYRWETKVTGESYLKRVRYRIGGYFGNTPYEQSGTQVRELAATAGFGLPLSILKSNSSLNFAFQYGVRGTGNRTDINETFVGFGVGFIFSPAPYERWFIKRKVD